jgi:hypothetical protein
MNPRIQKTYRQGAGLPEFLQRWASRQGVEDEARYQ